MRPGPRLTRRLRKLKSDWRDFGETKRALQAKSRSFNPLWNASLRAYNASKTVEALEAEEVLRGEIAGPRERISVSEGQVREQRARLAEIDRRVGEAWGRLRHAVERVKAMGVNNVLDHVNNEHDSEWADAIAVYRAAQPSDFTDKIGKTDAHLRLHALGFLSGPYPVGTFAEMGSIAEWGRFLNENEGLTEVLRSGSVMWSREKDALRDAEALLDEVDGGMGA